MKRRQQIVCVRRPGEFARRLILKIHGLHGFGLTPAQLKRLGERPVFLSVQQRGIKIETLRPLRPAERQTRLSTLLRKGFKNLQKKWPAAGFKYRGNGQLPWTLDAVMPAHSVERLAKASNVADVTIGRIQGLRRKPEPAKPGWYCVWGRVTIKIEGKRKGLVDIEDRLMLVRAHNEEAAKAKLKREWWKYNEPYLNPYGYLVRWELTGIEDVYSMYEGEIDPAGTEVFSRIRKRKMKAVDRWEKKVV